MVYPHTHFLLSTHPSHQYPYSIIGDWLIKKAVSWISTTAMGWDGLETFVWKTICVQVAPSSGSQIVYLNWLFTYVQDLVYFQSEDSTFK